jgi:hypothetical protein
MPAPQGSGPRGRGAGRAASGGGGEAPGDTGGPPAPDESKPSPSAPTPPQSAGETVAPENIPQSELSLRQIKDLLKDPEAAKKLAEDSGIPREEMEQFVQKLNKDKVPKGAARPGEEIQVKPGANRPAGPDPTLPGLDPRTSFSTKSLRQRGSIVQDDLRNNIETTRFLPPTEIRRGFEAYKSTLNRSRTLSPSTATNAPAPAPAAGPGSR